MKRIGKGTFSVAYLNDAGKVIIFSNDEIKECMATMFPVCGMFPAIEQVDSEKYERSYRETQKYPYVYEMEYFPKVRSLKNNLSVRQYRFYLALRDLFNNKIHYNFNNPFDNFFVLHAAFDTLPSEFKKERELLKEALDSIGNYSTKVCFEISPRNVAVKNKRLILLDCFFIPNNI